MKTNKENQEIESPVKAGLKTKEDIVNNWLPRYTGRSLEDFGEYILLTNFSNYVQLFSQMHEGAEILGTDKPMQTCTADGITIINFGMGSPVAATVMRSEEHTSELQSRENLVCRLLLEKKN